MYPTRRTNRPFGFIKHNGLNLAKSPSNPKSRLRRITFYLYVNGPRTRAQILQDVFGINSQNTSSVRGWGAYIFSAATEAGFVTQTRKGRTVMYDVGPAYLSLKVD
jgi:hypothetical protein